MNVEIICVGSELLSGDVVNTNASYISKKLRELGHESFRQFTVDDNKYRLAEVVNDSFKRCDILIVTGGLGPTADDITKETVCEALGLKLVENELCKKHLENFFRSAGRIPTANNFKQTTAPENAIIFKNDKGTACGMAMDVNSKHIILMPGPPSELTHMMDNYVVPYLKSLNHNAISTHVLNVFGIGESAIETLISDFCQKENPVVATYCGNNECAVKITATAKTQGEADSLSRRTLLDIKQVLGDYVYASDSLGMEHEVVNALRKSNLKISTAESCTGGMLSQLLTSVPNSSDVVEIGILAYSNRIKHEALSVPRDVLEEKGAISAETAMYLAKNVRILSDSDIGVGITGNAGPTASENKPVGLVFVAIADNTKYYVKKLTLPSTYDREKIRSYATLTALDLVRKYISARPYAMPGMVSFDSEFVFDEEPAKENEIFADASLIENKVASDTNANFIVYDPDEEDQAVSQPQTLPLDEETFETSVTSEADLTQLKITSEEQPADTEPTEDLKETKSVFKDKVLGLLFKVIPTRKDSIKDIVLKLVSILAVVGLLVSSTVLITHFVDENYQRGIISDARGNFDFENTDKNEESGTYNAFDNLYRKNPDIKGWISISNTNVDNPIYQTTDNDYYLNHNMLKQKSRYGALYFDYTNHIEFENNSKNLTIYGHDMRDKSMFGSLSKYRNLSFYKQNPVIKLKTLYEQHDYVIFATMVTNAKAADDNGYLYNYTVSQFESSESFLSWIDEALERSLINTGIEISEDDEILTLSTCCYDFNDARFVIMAKKLKNGQLADVSGAYYNKNARYPQAWYDKRGLEGYNKDDSDNLLPEDEDLPPINQSSTPSSSEDKDSSSTESDTSSENSSQNGSSSGASSGNSSKPSSSSTSTSSGNSSSSKPSSKPTSSDASSSDVDEGSTPSESTSSPSDTSSSNTPSDESSISDSSQDQENSSDSDSSNES